MRAQIIEALKKHAEGHIEKHKTNVEVLLQKTAGIAEHPDILETIEGHSPKGMCIQRTGPKQGYHVWHVEDGGQASCNRVVAYTLYLNDVEEGGETEYLYQGVKVKPEEGKLVFWPAGYTHPHRGNPIYEGYKYIITGWYTYDS